MSKEHLATYLNDHLMSVVSAIELVEQLSSEATDLKSFLEELKEDIEADRREVISLMERLDIPQSRLRRASGWLAEQVAEAKYQMDDDSLRRLERLEAVALGIQRNLSLWRALYAASRVDERLQSLDYERLTQRARDQRDRVEALRIDAAKSALTLAA
jgi:hypothetical protein